MIATILSAIAEGDAVRDIRSWLIMWLEPLLLLVNSIQAVS